MTNTQFDDILEQIESIKREVQGKSRRKVETIKKSLNQVYAKMYYETFYDKRFKIANYNKLVQDIENFDKIKFYMLFVRIPNIQKEYFNEGKYIKNAMKFIEYMKELSREEDGLMRKTVYLVSDYIIILVDKEFIEPIYKKVKAQKESFEFSKDYQMFFKKYTYLSSKINKNLKNVIKDVNAVFLGSENKE